MVVLALFLGAAVLCCSVLLVFGCVCHIFKRHGFTSFEDEESGRDVSMYSTTDSVHDPSNVTFEPLPDILAKTVSSRALRPRITCCDKEKQSAAAKLVTIYNSFPRNQLLYIKEVGLGWFGQVLQGSAENILPESRHIKVVVKILKDDATASEKALFLEEVAPFRDLEHANILRLLGQCTETTPFLTILEYPQLGDLKSYLLTNKSGPFIQFAIDAAKGLAHMHKHSYIHHDFAARNCLLMSDMTLKVGDYGIGEDLYREDYYDTGRDLLPIRWMSPESLEVKQGVWQLKEFTVQSNVWSLSVLLWEIVGVGRKPYINLRDEDVLLKVIRDGTTKLPPPSSDIPLHDRWFEIMEMCWQEVEDRPSAGDILAFLQQIEEEMASQSHDVSAVTSPVPVSQTGPQSPTSYDSKFVMSKNFNQSNQHVAEVLVHRVDDGEQKQGFDDDFSKSVKIRKNKTADGFEDDFVQSEENDSSILPQNDSIIAGGGNTSEDDKDLFSPDHNLNLIHPPVPVGMSTPSKQILNGKYNLSDGYNTALSNGTSQSSKYVTASDGNLHVSAFNPDFVRSNCQSISPFNPDFVRSDHSSKQSSKQLFGEKSDNQNNDEGYRTGISGSAPDIVLNNHSDTESTKQTSDLHTDNVSKQSDEMNVIPLTKLSPKFSDLETEKAKEIYMSKGAGLPSSIHKSRSLGTIPEDGIPSDNTSQSGVVFEDTDVDMGMNFEWDDYEGEQLVGRVRYTSDDSNASSRSPRQVEVEEWPFDQDSSSESHSKPGSIASDSDAEDGQLIKEDLDKIAESVLRKDDVLEVVVSQPHDQMLPNTVTDTVA